MIGTLQNKHKPRLPTHKYYCKYVTKTTTSELLCMVYNTLFADSCAYNKLKRVLYYTTTLQ